MPTPDNVKKLIADNGIKVVDLKFVDMPGTWQHFTIPSQSSTAVSGMKASASMAPASAASSRSRNPT